MKIRNIYIKLFISLLLALVALQVYFFVDLNFSLDDQIHPERNRNRVIKIQMLKELLEDKIHNYDGIFPTGNEFQDIITRVAKLYDARIWVEDTDGYPILESFPPENRPVKTTTGFNMSHRHGDVTISHVFENDIKTVYTEVPLDSGSGHGLTLHILYTGELVPYRSRFMIDLSVIILIMVMLSLSLLQLIRTKVNRLRKSVIRISDGDLKHRVKVDGSGVVEDLGRAFNNMTDKLEKMITSSKEITANMSHEIRTPLARMRVFEDLLRNKFDRGEFSGYERYLDNIRDDIQILDDLVGRLLEYVKLDQYKPIPKHERFKPSELINDLLIRFEPMIELKNLTIKKELLCSASISNDREALISTFLNLLDNAVKYTPEGGTITIRMDSGQGMLQTSIINSFGKIDQAHLSVIFKPFERVLKSENAGSGLGLAISKKIVENHGGTIAALNSSEGFEIRIMLPCQAHNAPA